MKNNRISSFISSHLRSAERQLSGFRKDRNSERFHHLRVDIKKIRAAFSFIETIHDEQFDLHPFKEIFRRAGEIREIGIHIDQLRLLPLFPTAVILQLRKRVTKLEQQFIGDIPRFLKRVRKFRKESLISFRHPGKNKVAPYFADRRKKAAKNFHSHNRKKMHLFRKQIKELMYIHSMLPGKTKRSTGLDKDLINTLQEQVGKWHDIHTMVTFLSTLKSDQLLKNVSAMKKREGSEFENLFLNYPDLKI